MDGTAASPRNATTKVGAASEARTLTGDELAARKAELEARGLPADHVKVVPSFRGKKMIEQKKQSFFPSNRSIKW